MDDGYCEGYAAFVLRDGRDADAITGDWLIVGWDDEGRPNDLAPFSFLLGFEAACTCGWRGSLWRVRAGEEGPEELEIRPGVTAEDDIRSQWLAHVGRMPRYE